MNASENHEAARAYASHGFPVFPLAPDTKVPVAESGGFKDATTDPNQIDRWWKEGPGRNVGIATGERSFDVLDIDKGKAGKPSGYVALNELKRAGLIPQYRTASHTPSGGMHFTFKGSEQKSGRLVNHSVDYRAEGGYVVVAPSKVDGKPYEIVQRNRIEPARLDWEAIVRHLEPERTVKPSQHFAGAAADRDSEVERIARWLEDRGPGDRNGSLFWAASRLAEKELLDDQARERLIVASERNGLRGGVREAERTISSASHGRDAHPKAQQGQREAGE